MTIYIQIVRSFASTIKNFIKQITMPVSLEEDIEKNITSDLMV